MKNIDKTFDKVTLIFGSIGLLVSMTIAPFTSVIGTHISFSKTILAFIPVIGHLLSFIATIIEIIDFMKDY